MKASTKRSKELYDTKTSYNNYKAGDIIWCRHESRKVGVCQKLEKIYDGPYMVKSKTSPFNFLIQINKDGQEKLVHHDKLKPYEGTSPPKWIVKAKKKLSKQ
jgi:hypothetical protein